MVATLQPEIEKPIRVLIIDDVTIFRAGIRLLIESQSNAMVAGEAQNRDEALAMIASRQPDIILLNLELKSESGLDLIPELLAATKQARIIALTSLRSSAEQARAIQLGARGIVLKESKVSSLINAIEKVRQGGSWFEPSVSEKLLGRMVNIANSVGKIDPEIARIDALTERERKIVALAGEGLKNQEIAERLFISEGTVRNHLTVIYEKLGVTARYQLIVYALRHHLTNNVKSEEPHS